jgi:hypothetical protein
MAKRLIDVNAIQLQIAISQEDFNMLVGARELLDKIWQEFGPYDFPNQELRHKMQDFYRFDDSL